MADENEIKQRLLAALGGREGVKGLLGGSTSYQAIINESSESTSHPNGSTPNLEDSAKRLIEQVTQQNKAPLTLYLVFDTTGSMRSYIEAVRECTTQVGTEVLNSSQGLEACVLGVGDHCDKTSLQRAGVKMLGDYGQDNIPTTNPAELTRQVASIINTNGGDTPEAYECLAADLVARIGQKKRIDPTQKNVVVLMGDATPHIQKSYNDDGCPYQRGPDQLLALATMSTRTYFVDCNTARESSFQRVTYGAARQSPKAIYLRFDQAKDILPEALISMVKEAQSPQQLADYLAKLSPEKAKNVAGLLGTGRR